MLDNEDKKIIKNLVDDACERFFKNHSADLRDEIAEYFWDGFYGEGYCVDEEEDEEAINDLVASLLDKTNFSFHFNENGQPPPKAGRPKIIPYHRRKVKHKFRAKCTKSPLPICITCIIDNSHFWGYNKDVKRRKEV